MNLAGTPTLVDVLVRAKNLSNEGITFIEGSDKEEFLSYPELYARSLNILFNMQQAGIRSGDEVILQIERNRDFIEMFWACIMGGMIAVPLAPVHNEESFLKLFNVYNLLGKPFIISGESNIARIQSLGNKVCKDENVLRNLLSTVLTQATLFDGENVGELHRPSPLDIAYIQFSSGSTGDPKGVMLTHQNLVSNIESIHDGINSPAEGDTFFSWMPLVHDMGLIGFHLTPIYAGWSHFLMPTELFIKHPALWLSKISEHRISFTSSPNFGYSYVMQHFNEANHSSLDLSGLRVIVNGAEPISSDICERFTTTMKKYGLKENVIFPVYGLAESSLAVTFSDVDQNFSYLTIDRNSINIGDTIQETKDNGIAFVKVGRSVREVEIQIVDNEGNSAGEKMIGKIRIKGKSVTQGYYKNPRATREVISEDGWLDTGDLGFVVDGNLYVTGRHKDIFFVNGKNFYPHDVENIAQRVPGLKLNQVAVAGYHNEKIGRDEVLAFVVHKRNENEFFEIGEKLKAYVAQSTNVDIDHVLPVSRIPKTSSGKIQRYKLLTRYRQGDFDAIRERLKNIASETIATDFSGNGDATTLQIASLWRDKLNIPATSVDDNFFALGGNSLKAGNLAAQLSDLFNTDISIDVIFREPTIAAQAAYVRSGKNTPSLALKHANNKEYYPLTGSQKGIYYHWQANPDSLAYNLPRALDIRGPLDYDRLLSCIHSLVRKYEIFRTTFHLAGGEPVQKIHSYHKDLCDVEFIRTNQELTEKEFLIYTERFDLSENASRFKLIQSAPEHYTLFIDIHHIIIDGISYTQVVNELFKLYDGGKLPEAGYQYKDYSVWYNDNSVNRTWQSQEKFWLEQLGDDVPSLEPGTDFTRPAQVAYTGKKMEFVIPSGIFRNLKNFAIGHQVTLHTLSVAVYQLLLHRFTGQRKVVSGIPVSGRNLKELRQMPGMFVNSLPLISSYDPDQSFIHFLNEIRNTLIGAFANQDYSNYDLTQAFNLNNPHQKRSSLYNTMFMYQDFAVMHEPSGLEIESRSFDPGISRFDISMEVVEHGDFLTFNVEYSDQLFESRTIRSFADSYLQLLQSSVSNPNKNIGTLGLISPAERKILTSGLQHKAVEAGVSMAADAHSQFEDIVRSHGNLPAVHDNNKYYTFDDLNERANRLSHTLTGLGVGPNVLVAIACEPSIHFMTAVLAVIKSGGAYVPIDTAYPWNRKRYIVRDRSIKTVLTTTSHRDTETNYKEEGVSNILYLDGEACYSNNRTTPPVTCKPKDLAYVIYTSGTTGYPKGTAITHANLMAYIRWASCWYTSGIQSPTFALFTSISFDLTVTSIFVPVLTGNLMRIYNSGSEETVTLIQRIVTEDLCDVIKLTPSHLKILNECDEDVLRQVKNLRRFIVGGEQLETALCRDITNKLGSHVEIYNEYGPTEATVGCVVHKFDATSDNQDAVPIGLAVPNNRVYILDEKLEPVPTGFDGELYIAGDQVAQGYLSKQELTLSKFLPDPFVENGRMYRTGDIVSFQKDNVIRYKGRRDGMIKINGHRIEMGEIENMVRRFAGIKDAVVTENDRGGRKFLVAYYSTDDAVDAEQLKYFLLQNLPGYMVPAHLQLLENIPLNINGKVDKSALPPISFSSDDNALPADEIQEVLLELFEQVLKVENIGINDSFYALAGDSIKAVQIVSRLQKRGYKVSVKDVLLHQTINRISPCVVRTSLQSQAAVTGVKPFTPIDRWFFRNIRPDRNFYCQSVLLSLQPDTDVDLLCKSFNQLISHHDGLRLNYNSSQNQLYFNDTHTGNFQLPVYDEMNDRISLELKKSLDIENGLLFKAALIKEQDGDSLLIVAHHLVIDGVSWRILLEDLYEAYQQLKSNSNIRLNQKSSSLKDCASRLSELGNMGYFDNEIEYWNAIESRRVRLPDDFDFRDLSESGIDTFSFSLKPDDTEYLIHQASQFYNTDASVLLLTALTNTLSAWTGSKDIVVELEGHGRDIEGVDPGRTVGWFTSIFPVLLPIVQGPLSKQILKVKETIREIPHGGIGYGVLRMSPENRIHESVVRPQVRFNYLGEFDLQNDLFSFSNKGTGRLSAEENAATILIEFNVMVVEGVMTFEVSYDRNFFKTRTLENVTQNFQKQIDLLIQSIRKEDQYYISASDFNAVALDEQELDVLFNMG